MDPCSIGEYQPNYAMKDGSCIDCPAGFKCTQNDDDFVDTPCEAGYYCPARTSEATKQACGTGTFNPNTTSMSIAACIDCQPGWYCAGTG